MSNSMSNDPLSARPSPVLVEVFTAPRSAEIAFWTELAMSYGRVVINWHCGTGELALGLAKNGLRVVGVDPDPEAVEIARAREREENVTKLVEENGETVIESGLMLTWLCHEPRLVSLPGAADFAMLSGDSFGDYLQADQRVGLLNNLFHHLRPGGAIGISIPMAPASGVIHNKYISGPMRPLPKGAFARRVSTLRYDATQSVLSGYDDVMVRMGEVEQNFREHYTRQLYSPDQIFQLLWGSGFINVGMWGGWDRRPLRQADRSFIVRAERPATRSVGIRIER
jgi:SAM-dependent methyltransferase